MGDLFDEDFGNKTSTYVPSPDKPRPKFELMPRITIESPMETTRVYGQVSAKIRLNSRDESVRVLKYLSPNARAWNIRDGMSAEEYSEVISKRTMAMYIEHMLKVATCLNGYSKMSFVAHGRYGIVCSVWKDDKEYAVKFQLADEQLLHEVAIMKKCDKIGDVSAKLYEVCFVEIETLTSFVAIMIMEMIPTTLRNLFMESALDIHQLNYIGFELRRLLDTMRKESFGHHDMHLANIGYRTSDSKFILLDFGLGSLNHYTIVNSLSLLRGLCIPVQDATNFYKRNCGLLLKYIADNSEKFGLAKTPQDFYNNFGGVGAKNVEFKIIDKIYHKHYKRYELSAEKQEEIEVVNRNAELYFADE
jgi:hypothetical protein